MTTPMKWLFSFLLIITLVLVIAYSSATQNIATRTTSEVEILAETLSVGLIRSEIDEGDDIPFFDKDEIITNLVSHVSDVQKNHKYDIQLDYVFLDKDGDITENDDDIRGLQFRVSFIDDAGEVRGEAEKRLTINYPSS